MASVLHIHGSMKFSSAVNKVLIFSLLALFAGQPVFAGAKAGSGAELTAIINSARADSGGGRPAAALPPLVLNNNLSLVAHKVAAGSSKTPEELSGELGLLVVSSDWCRATIYFNNFQSVEKSVASLARELIRRDSALPYASSRSILRPGNTDFGFDLAPVRRRSGNSLLIGYRLTIVVAESACSANDLVFLQLINQGRRSPLAVAAALGLDRRKLKEEFAGDPDILSHGLPPLNMDAAILAAGNRRAAETLRAGQNTPRRLTGGDITALLAREGYRTDNRAAVTPCEIFTSLTFPAGLIDPAAFANMLFGSVFKEEIRAADPAAYCFLQRGITGAGIAILNGQTFMAGHNTPSWTTIQTEALFSTHRQPLKPVISGLVYKDINKNGLYDIGEGTANVKIDITGVKNGYKLQLYTDGAGGFAVPAASGSYRLRVSTDSGPRYRAITVQKDNVGVVFKLLNRF